MKQKFIWLFFIFGEYWSSTSQGLFFVSALEHFISRIWKNTLFFGIIFSWIFKTQQKSKMLSFSRFPFFSPQKSKFQKKNKKKCPIFFSMDVLKIFFLHEEKVFFILVFFCVTVMSSILRKAQNRCLILSHNKSPQGSLFFRYHMVSAGGKGLTFCTGGDTDRRFFRVI